MPVHTFVGCNQLVRMLDDWGTCPQPLHAGLASRIRRLVHEGGLPAGSRLPSERALALGLGVSRNTVGAAFDELRAEGVLASRQGAGTYVTLAGHHAAARGDDRLGQYAAPQGPDDDRIDLRSAALPGLPMVVEEFAAVSTADLAALVPTHGYLSGGLPQLREAVAGYYADLGLPTSADQVLITSGAQQAVRLVATAFCEPGDTVVVEEPTFRGAIEVLRGAGARLVPVIARPGPVDGDALRRVVRAVRPALILVQTTVHNPTGDVWGESSRARLAAVASETGVPVVDDAAPADALVDGDLPRPLAAYGAPTITIGSASKAFWGGLRVGWLRADAAVVRRLAAIKGGEDLGTSMVAQLLTVRLLARVAEARSLRRARLSVDRALMLDALAELLPQWRPTVPAGGASVWVRLPGPGATSFAQRCDRRGVCVLPGTTFSGVDGLDDHLRIAFALEHTTVRRGLERMAAAWTDHLARTHQVPRAGRVHPSGPGRPVPSARAAGAGG